MRAVADRISRVSDEPRALLDHLTVTASDLAASLRMYDAALGCLGLVRRHELRDEEEDDVEVEAVGYGLPDGPALIWLVAGTAPTTAAHVSLRAGDRATVQRFHDAAVAAGGASHDAPRRWPVYRRGEFNSIVEDPDGNLIEAVADE